MKRTRPSPFAGELAVLVPTSTYREHCLSPGPMWLYVYLLDRCQALGRPRCRPSLADLAGRARRSCETIKRNLRALEGIGLVSVKRRRGRPSIVLLTDPEAVLACSLTAKQRLDQRVEVRRGN